MDYLNDDRPREKCAVVGVSINTNNGEAAQIAHLALFALQHRGSEATGIVTSGNGSELCSIKSPGLVRDVFNSENIGSLNGNMAIGHNRYSTDGGREAHMQPVISEAINFAFAHNGTIPDTDQLIAYLSKRGYITDRYNDSELFALSIASKLHGERDLVEAIKEVQELAIGAYSCVAMHKDTMVAFRDSNGIRPLELGEFADGGIIVASETCALDAVGAKHVRPINPGELIVIKKGKVIKSIELAKPKPTFDVFEMVYFARADSYLLGQRVNEVRRRFGQELAKLHPPLQAKLDDIIVAAVPDTSIPATEGFTEALGLKHESIILKNRYIGRTFMLPNQASRHSDLQLKHTMISERIAGKHLYMIDDSIVRGNTLPRLVKLAKQLKAKSVSVLIASPPIRFPDFYGVDTPRQSDLMAANMTVEEMRQAIGADYLGFLTIEAMVRATKVPADQLNLASFNGVYPVSIGKRAKEVGQPRSREFIE